MSTYDDDLRFALKPQLDSSELRDAGDSAGVFRTLCKSFPTSGSKIDWSRVPGAIESFEENLSMQRERFAQFFESVEMRFGLTGPVTYAGDSATEFALEGEIEAIRKALPALLEVPQHHYFVGPGCSWCICLTTEGDMGFARREAITEM